MTSTVRGQTDSSTTSQLTSTAGRPWEGISSVTQLTQLLEKTRWLLVHTLWLLKHFYTRERKNEEFQCGRWGLSSSNPGLYQCTRWSKAARSSIAPSTWRSSTAKLRSDQTSRLNSCKCLQCLWNSIHFENDTKIKFYFKHPSPKFRKCKLEMDNFYMHLYMHLKSCHQMTGGPVAPMSTSTKFWKVIRKILVTL